jgi:DNA-binding LacI/PurR family transcriptional regulator/DNA-binding transcriptional regulator YhcF (GntR family)
MIASAPKTLARPGAHAHSFDLPAVRANSPVPLYLQVKTILIESIEKGLLKPGRQLPNTCEISRQLRVSPLTAHRALQSLAQEGWLLRRQGQCTVVRPDYRSAVERKPRHRVAVAVKRDSLGRDPRVQVLLAGTVAGTGEFLPHIETTVCSYVSIAELKSLNADGILSVCPDVSDFSLLEDIASERHVVVVGATAPSASLHCVDSDHSSAARLAVRHLIGLGHSRIALAAGPEPGTAVRQRMDGFAAELAAAGFETADPWTIDAWSVLRRKTRRQRFFAQLAGRCRPTAVFVADLPTAVCTLALLQQEGIRVPESVSVIGCEEGSIAEQLLPALTTVSQPLHHLAMRAVARLEELLNGTGGPTGNGVEALAATLSVRHTTAPPFSPALEAASLAL